MAQEMANKNAVFKEKVFFLLDNTDHNDKQPNIEQSLIKSNYKSDLVYPFAITINISPKKVVRKGCKWDSMHSLYQQVFFNNLIDSIDREYRVDIQFIFELTKNGMVHLHGKFYADEATAGMIQLRVHMLCGFPRLAPHICCFVERTKYDICYWHTYMHKYDANVTKKVYSKGKVFLKLKKIMDEDKHDSTILSLNPMT